MDREQTFELYNGKPLAEQVADHIVNYIVENEMEAGAKLPNEFELAERIGVGRSTVREAIKILVSRNIVEIRRGAGTFVSEQKGCLLYTSYSNNMTTTIEYKSDESGGDKKPAEGRKRGEDVYKRQGKGKRDKIKTAARY